MAAGRIPELPVWVDSPMAVEATAIFRRHAAEHDFSEARMAGVAEAMASPFVRLAKTAAESKAINAARRARDRDRLERHDERRPDPPSSRPPAARPEDDRARGRFSGQGHPRPQAARPGRLAPDPWPRHSRAGGRSARSTPSRATPTAPSSAAGSPACPPRRRPSSSMASPLPPAAWPTFSRPPAAGTASCPRSDKSVELSPASAPPPA